MSRTPLKTRVKPQKHPRSCSIKKKVFLEILQISQENACIEVSFNRVSGQETQTQIFSCGVYKMFKNWNVRATASETCLTWSVLLNKLHLRLKLVNGLCIIIYSFACQFSLCYSRYCYDHKHSSGGALQKKVFLPNCKNHWKTPALRSHF